MPTQQKSSILITGASNGIGAALALAYASPQTTLGLIGRNAKRLEEIADKCRQKGAIVHTGVLDLTNTAALTSWMQSFDSESPVTLLIANAGVTNQISENGEAESIQDICHLLNTNLYGVIHSIDAILPAMKARGSGQIAITSSLAAYRGMPVTPSYCASKAAVKSYGEALRGWLAPKNIKVNIICPGFVSSNMSNTFNAPKPFMISAERAAIIIKVGLKKNKAIISFPFPLSWGMRAISMLPFSVSLFFLNLSGYNKQ